MGKHEKFLRIFYEFVTLNILSNHLYHPLFILPKQIGGKFEIQSRLTI